MPKVFTIDDTWNEMPWFNTGGTREKRYLQGPDGNFYYFKKSQNRPGKYYKYEFWNEIIAFDLGMMLGFNVLRYDIAIDREDSIGCICKSMIDNEKQELIEGVKYIQAFAPDYNPAKREHQNRYTFHMIEHSLAQAKLSHYVNEIIKLIVFDSIIGNGDRHQENWATIKHHYDILPLLNEIDKSKEGSWWQRRKIKYYKWWISRKQRIEEKTEVLAIEIFSPIYDSGSCLGRELTDEKVTLYLSDNNALEAYLNRGKSEIHWNSKKVKHLELIKNLKNSEHSDFVTEIIKKSCVNFSPDKMLNLVNQIDMALPEHMAEFKIPADRKELIVKMVTLRIQRLRELSND